MLILFKHSQFTWPILITKISDKVCIQSYLEISIQCAISWFIIFGSDICRLLQLSCMQHVHYFPLFRVISRPSSAVRLLKAHFAAAFSICLWQNLQEVEDQKWLLHKTHDVTGGTNLRVLGSCTIKFVDVSTKANCFESDLLLPVNSFVAHFT